MLVKLVLSFNKERPIERRRGSQKIIIVLLPTFIAKFAVSSACADCKTEIKKKPILLPNINVNGMMVGEYFIYVITCILIHKNINNFPATTNLR